MKSLQNITKEIAYYRGKEITHGIGYSSFMIEHNKLLKKYKRSHSGNSSTGFEVEADFQTYIGLAAECSHAAWDAVAGNGEKWEIRTRDFTLPSSTVCFVNSSDAIRRLDGPEVNKAIEFKCSKVDMFLICDTSLVREKGLLEWWEIPSKVILELYRRDEWKQTVTKNGSLRKAHPRVGKDCWIKLLISSRFHSTMSYLFNK
jgi:hypothetical protein